MLDLDGEESPEGTAKPVVSADFINRANREGCTAAPIAASEGFKVCQVAAGLITQLCLMSGSVVCC